MRSGPLVFLNRPIGRTKAKASSLGQRKNFSSTPNPSEQRIIVMPLPNITNGTAPRCTATNRKTGNRCHNPAAFGMATCRYHGARKPNTVCQGPRHPQYRHGMETLDAKRKRKIALERIRRIITSSAYEVDLKAQADQQS